MRIHKLHRKLISLALSGALDACVIVITHERLGLWSVGVGFVVFVIFWLPLDFLVDDLELRLRRRTEPKP